jgi:hypothetical protein
VCSIEVVVGFGPAFEAVGLPMLERVKSILLILMGENQSIIQRLMLCFELERAYKLEPQHLGGARDEGVAGIFSAFEMCTYETPLSR